VSESRIMGAARGVRRMVADWELGGQPRARGPDDNGVWCAPAGACALGHTRPSNSTCRPLGAPAERSPTARSPWSQRRGPTTSPRARRARSPSATDSAPAATRGDPRRAPEWELKAVDNSSGSVSRIRGVERRARAIASCCCADRLGGERSTTVERFQFLVRLGAKALRAFQSWKPRFDRDAVGQLPCSTDTSRRRGSTTAMWGGAPPGQLGSSWAEGANRSTQVTGTPVWFASEEMETRWPGNEDVSIENASRRSHRRVRVAWSRKCRWVYSSRRPDSSLAWWWRRYCSAYGGGDDVRHLHIGFDDRASRVGAREEGGPGTGHPPHRADRDREGHARQSSRHGRSSSTSLRRKSGVPHPILSRGWRREHVKLARLRLNGGARGSQRLLPLGRGCSIASGRFRSGPGVASKEVEKI